MIKFLNLIPMRFRYFILEYGALSVAAVFFVAAALAVFIYVQPNPIVATGYEMGEVLFTLDTTDEDTGFSVRATVRLEDGATTYVSAHSIVQAQWLLKPVCLQRNTHENDRVRYRLVRPDNCEA